MRQSCLLPMSTKIGDVSLEGRMAHTCTTSPRKDGQIPTAPLRRLPRRKFPIYTFITFVFALLTLLLTMFTWPRDATRTVVGLLLTSSVMASQNFTATVDIGWHAPSKTRINANFDHVLQDEGIYGYIYDTSQTPDDKYGIYNWCNMPHVRKREYVKPPPEYELQFVELIHRHHKRTPYASNGFPVEPYPWNCDDQGLFYYGERLTQTEDKIARTYWRVYQSPINPFTPSGWTGSCQFPQITAEGLDDSLVHGKDLFEVYHDLLGFLPASLEDASWPERIRYRVTNNQITSQVAGSLLNGMWGTTDRIGLHVQPSAVDSLEPKYSCPRGSSLFDRIKSGNNPTWRSHLSSADNLYTTLDGITGVTPDHGGFHASFDPYYDNLSARQCHGKPLPCKIGGGQKECITQELAETVYRIGHWEYSQIYRDSETSLAASASTYGVWVTELAGHLRAAVAGENNLIYFHNIAHDGSVSRLLSVLQIDVMVWPGMGAEVIFELYRKRYNRIEANESGWYVRVLFGGQVLESSSPTLGKMNMVPVETLLAYFDGLVGENSERLSKSCQN